MQKHEIISDLATRCDISEEDAETTMMQSLTTLATAMPADEAKDAAAQLPTDFANALDQASKKPVENDPEVLIADLAEKLGVDGDTARERFGQAMATLRDGLTGGEWVDVASVLPDELLKIAPSK